MIASNNKKGWVNPEPAIRISNSKAGKVTGRAHEVEILDAEGNCVAKIVSTIDGKPVISCGAKVGVFTKYPVKVVG